MEKKVFISLPKGKEATNVQFNVVDGKIEVSYNLEEVLNPKDGDFLVNNKGEVFIFSDITPTQDETYSSYCGVYGFNRGCISTRFSRCSVDKYGCRYATEDEKFDFLLRLEDECAKTWDFKEKKLIDVIKPKPGDFVISCNNTMFIFLSKEKGLYCGIYDMKNQFGQHSKYSTCIKVASMAEFRYATEEEKKEYLDFIRLKFNQKWNPEKLCFEEARWRAKNGNIYYYVSSYMSVNQEEDIRTDFDGLLYEYGNYFRTSEAAKKVADQIKEIFKNSKAE